MRNHTIIKRLKGMRLFIACCALGVHALSAGGAQASTATFVGSPAPSDSALSALSTSGDDAGFFLPVNQTVGLLFDQPFATSRTDSVSVFSLPSVGRARLTVRFGVYNDGNPTFVRQIRFQDERNRRVGNLFSTRLRRLRRL